MNLVDLTYPIENGMTTANVNWHPRVEIVQVGRTFVEGSETHKLVLGSHSGTHMDAPAHMISRPRRTIDQYDLAHFWGNGKMMRIPKNNFEAITKEDLINTGVDLNDVDRVVINTGWYKKHGTKEFLVENPYFEEEAAQYLIEQGIKLVCMDMPTPENPDQSRNAIKNIIHKMFFSADIAIVEYMTNLDALPPQEEFELITLPLLLKNVEGSPIRAIAKVKS